MRPPSCCCKNGINKDWSKEEDAKIVAYVSNHGTTKWTALPKKAGVKRCGKCCKIRWTYHLKPGMGNGNFTPEEEDLIVKLHAAVGSRWSLIAKLLEGKSEKDVKKHWTNKLAKKLMEKGIDLLTHKSFPHIMSERLSKYTIVASTQQATAAPKANKKAKVEKTNKLPTIPEEEE